MLYRYKSYVLSHKAVICLGGSSAVLLSVQRLDLFVASLRVVWHSWNNALYEKAQLVYRLDLFVTSLRVVL